MSAAPAPDLSGASENGLATALLCHRRDLVPVVASWLLAEWPDWYGRGGPGNLQGDVEAFSASPSALPIGVVVFSGAEPVGFAALKPDSIPSHMHLAPWAAAGYVVPDRRGCGIGAALLQTLVSHAASLGLPAVYCGTHTATRLLERAGWQLHDTTVHAGQPLGIYRTDARGGR